MPSPTRLYAFFLAVLLVFLGALGFFLLFGSFAPLGPEGQSLLAVRAHFASGGLYGALFSKAGPFFFGLLDLVQVFSGPLDSTGARLVGLLCWLSCAGLTGYGVLRATRNFALAGFAAGGVFLSLHLLRFEPLQPGLLVLLALGLLVLFAGHSLDLVEKPFRHFGVAAGALAACVLLCRFNVGVLLCAALACFFFASFAGEGRLWRTLLLAFPPLVATALMVPLVDQPWVRTFILCFSGLALALGLNCSRFPRTNLSTREFGLGFGITVLIAGAYPLFRGAHFADLLEGAILLPMLHPGDYVHPIDWRPETLPLVVVSLGFAVAYAWSRGRRAGRIFEHVLVSLRLLQFTLLCVGLVLLLHEELMGAVYSFCLTLSWTWCAPLLDKNPTAFSLRVLLGYLLLFLSLHAYPAGGHQQAWGFFLLFPLCAIGMRETQVWASRIGFLQLKRSLQVVGVVSLLLVLGEGGRLLWSHYKSYESRMPLGLQGTAGLRMETAEADLYRNLTKNAQVHAEQLLSLPGLYCLNLWSGVSTPSAENVVFWYAELPLQRQAAIIAKLEMSPGACVVINEKLLAQDALSGAAHHGPLYDYVRTQFTPAFQVGDYLFAAKKQRTINPIDVAYITNLDGGRKLVTLSLLHDGSPLYSVSWQGGQRPLSALKGRATDATGKGGQELATSEAIINRIGFLRLSFEIEGATPDRLEVLGPGGRAKYVVLLAR